MIERLNCNAVAIQLPIGKEDDFKGIIDLVKMKAIIYKDDLGKDMEYVDVPEDMKDLADEYRAKQESLINQGRFREAVNMDINDIRSKFGGKYDQGIKELLNYVDELERINKI